MALESTEETTDKPLASKSIWRRCGRGLKRLSKAFLVAAIIYGSIVLVGLIPVNNDFQPTPDGIEILVISNAVHADLVVPIKSTVIDWRDHFPENSFASDTTRATHVAIGWGDKGFFMETPTWADLRISVAARALLWPSDASVHVSMTNADFIRQHGRSVRISEDQYQRLVDHVTQTLKHDSNGATILIPDSGYGSTDAFYEAHGNYNCVNTCNSWVGRVLKSSGVRTGWMTPLPKTVYWYFPT